MNNTVITVEFILYLAIILGIGLYFARKKMCQADFHLGGKKIPGWALALSERATGESAWCLLGLTGFAFAAGLSSIWIAIGCVAGIGCSFSPAVILSFFWKRFNANGVVASLVSGFIATLTWMIPGLDKTIGATFVTFWVSLIFAVGVTLLTGEKFGTAIGDWSPKGLK